MRQAELIMIRSCQVHSIIQEVKKDYLVATCPGDVLQVDQCQQADLKVTHDYDSCCFPYNLVDHYWVLAVGISRWVERVVRSTCSLKRRTS